MYQMNLLSVHIHRDVCSRGRACEHASLCTFPSGSYSSLPITCTQLQTDVCEQDQTEHQDSLWIFMMPPHPSVLFYRNNLQCRVFCTQRFHIIAFKALGQLSIWQDGPSSHGTRHCLPMFTCLWHNKRSIKTRQHICMLRK